MDINGDGLTDIFPNYLNPQFQPPDLLKSVTTSKGAFVSVRYDGALKQVNASNELLSDNMPCLLYTSPSPRDATLSRMPSSA